MRFFFTTHPKILVLTGRSMMQKDPDVILSLAHVLITFVCPRQSLLISCWWQWKEHIYVFLKLLGLVFIYFWVEFFKSVSPLHLKTEVDVLAVTHQFYWSMLPLQLYTWFVFVHALMLLLISLPREPNALLMFGLLQDIRNWVKLLAEHLLMKNWSCGIEYILKRMIILQLYCSLTCWWLSKTTTKKSKQKKKPQEKTAP